MTKIDPKLPVRTRDGRPALILTTDVRNKEWPIMGYIGDDTDLVQWTPTGRAWSNNYESPRDLIQDREVWVNIYDQDFLAVFPTKEAAQRSTKTPIARVRVPYTPGQFDD